MYNCHLADLQKSVEWQFSDKQTQTQTQTQKESEVFLNSPKGSGYKSTVCGVYSNLTVYPDGKDVQFILTYVYLRTFLLIATFDLLSPNIIVTSLTAPDISNSKIEYFTDFKIADIQIETLHFVTLKYKLIRIQLRDDVIVTIYDGPGILSKSYGTSKKNLTFISSFFNALQNYILVLKDQIWFTSIYFITLLGIMSLSGIKVINTV